MLFEDLPIAYHSSVTLRHAFTHFELRSDGNNVLDFSYAGQYLTPANITKIAQGPEFNSLFEAGDINFAGTRIVPHRGYAGGFARWQVLGTLANNFLHVDIPSFDPSVPESLETARAAASVKLSYLMPEFHRP
jgi:hypothetical protein